LSFRGKAENLLLLIAKLRGWALVTEALLQEGFSGREIRQVMGENVVRVLVQVLPE
jgi:microsomal dipeptidase-like Zn-dependent dipeptidase